MITGKQAQDIRDAIELLQRKHWSCWLVSYACGAKISREYGEFFGHNRPGKWEGLNLPAGASTDQDNLQRELMLELFAHTRGKL